MNLNTFMPSQEKKAEKGKRRLPKSVYAATRQPKAKEHHKRKMRETDYFATTNPLPTTPSPTPARLPPS